MKRRHRKNYDELGYAHELTFSCYRGFKFLQSDRTCQWLVESIEESRQKNKFLLWAYVFMPEHVHLMILPTQAESSVAVIRSEIKAPVGSKAIAYLEEHAPHWLPRVTRTRGGKTERLFWASGGGYDRNVDSPKTLMAMINYIHANSIRRGLVERARDWRWSSAAWYDDLTPIPLAVDPIPPEWLVGVQ